MTDVEVGSVKRIDSPRPMFTRIHKFCRIDGLPTAPCELPPETCTKRRSGCECHEPPNQWLADARWHAVPTSDECR